MIVQSRRRFLVSSVIASAATLTACQGERERGSSQATLLKDKGSVVPGPAQIETPSLPSVPASCEAVFPLSVRTGRRHFVDAAGNPFMLHGDTAWSLVVQASREQVEFYLENRKRRSFNAILVNLIEHKFATKPPSNFYGAAPFIAPGDFGAVNDVYFAYADWVISTAAAKGILVLLAPAYMGYKGGDEGWYQEMLASGTTRLRGYGRYLGKRYRNYDNILWVSGGDYNPPRRELASAIVDGIRDEDPRSLLHTAHCGRFTAPVDYWTDQPWLNVNNVYTDETVYPAALKQYNQPSRMPFFLIESRYEGHPGFGHLPARVVAYQAMLSGATGHVYGNAGVWPMGGPGLYPQAVTWREALDSIGAESMTRLRSLLCERPWWLLEPDQAGAFLIDGKGGAGTFERALGACASDGSFAVVYMPSARPIAVNLSRLTGPRINAKWCDPASGRLSVAAAAIPAAGSRRFAPMRTFNSVRDSDWVLLLESMT